MKIGSGFFGLMTAAVVGTLVLSGPVAANVIFEDHFDEGSPHRWHVGGDGTATLKPYLGDMALRLTKRGYAMAAVKIRGQTMISIEVKMGASNLESGDFCVAESSADGGAQWMDILRLTHEDDQEATWQEGTEELNLPGDLSTLVIRLRAESNSNSDVCWADDVKVVIKDAMAP